MTKKVLVVLFVSLFSFLCYETVCSYFFTMQEHSKKIIVESDSSSVFSQQKAMEDCIPHTDSWVPGSLQKCIDAESEVSNEITPTLTDRGLTTNIILYLIWFCLNIQLLVAARLYWGGGSRKYYPTYFSLSEWCINSPPMLGVLGTILSFAFMVSTTEGSPVEVFRENFMIAAITTIFGGSVYILNLLLGVVIYPVLNRHAV